MASIKLVVANEIMKLHVFRMKDCVDKKIFLSKIVMAQCLAQW